MKKCILSAIGGALTMLVAIVIAANISANSKQEPEEYEHIDYVSSIEQASCAFCGDSEDALFAQYPDEDNVAIVNLNTFEYQKISMNSYDENGQMIAESEGYYKGYMVFGQDTYVHSKTFFNRSYATVEIHNSKYSIDIEFLESNLCQDCLDMLNVFYWTEEAPPECAVINFKEKEIRPLDQCLTWFMMGNYGVDCDYKDNGNIFLRVFYCPPRYS